MGCRCVCSEAAGEKYVTAGGRLAAHLVRQHRGKKRTNKEQTKHTAKGKTAENSGDEEEAQADHDGDVFLLIGSD